MTRRAAVLPLLLLLQFVACGESDRTPPAASGAAPSAAGSAAVAARGGTDEDGGEPGSSGGMPGAGGAGLDSVEIIDVDELGPCEPVTAEPQVFMAPEPLELVFDRAGSLGGRRFALDSVSLALMTFESDEASASPIAYAPFMAAAPLGDALVTLELAEQGELVARAYDGQLMPGQPELTLDVAGTVSHALGAASDELLAVYCDGSELRGQRFTPSELVGDGFDFGPRSCGDNNRYTSVLWSGERYVVLWSRVDVNDHSVVSWAAIDRDAGIVSSRNVLDAEDRYQLVGATQLSDGRVAVLLTEGAPANAPVLMFLNAFGAPERRLYRFLGASEAWGVVSAGDGLALVARSNDSQAVLRRVGADGSASEPWICLDDSGIDTAFEPRAALFAESGGYGAVIRLTDGSAAYLALE